MAAVPASGQSVSSNARNLPNETWERYQGQLTNASATLITAPVAGAYRIWSIVVSEVSNVAKTFTLRHVESGGTDDATADLYQQAALAARETIILEGTPLVTLKNGDVLKALASANSAVNVLVNYSAER